MLFEVALLEPHVDIGVWISFIKFVQKDIVSARALFERCRQSLQNNPSRLADLIHLNLVNAIFEEE